MYLQIVHLIKFFLQGIPDLVEFARMKSLNGIVEASGDLLLMNVLLLVALRFKRVASRIF